MRIKTGNMVIEKQKDGSTKVVYENGDCYFVEKGKDPIDGVIDIALRQKKMATAIRSKSSIKKVLKPELFFSILSLDYNIEAWFNNHKRRWFMEIISEFNYEIKKQQLLRQKNKSDYGSNKSYTSRSTDENKPGKYFLSTETTIPDFAMKISEAPMNFSQSFFQEIHETQEELHERFVARSLLNFIFCRVDLRKIEARISEIKGLCAYLKMTAPDEYNAYCILADRIGLNARLDTERYYQVLKQLG